MSRASSGRRSPLAARLALAVGATLTILVLAELGLRLAGLPAAPSDAEGMRAIHELQLHEPWIYGPRPGARATLDLSGSGPILYEINEDGFRDPLRARPKPDGVRRILVLGDSVVFGYGVASEQAFPSRMEALLPSEWEVLNFGVTGYNTYTEAELFLARGLGYEPDIVLLTFFTNDLNDSSLHFDTQTRVHLGALPDEAFPNPELRRHDSAWQRWLLPRCRRSRLCALVDDGVLARLSPPPHDAMVEALVSSDSLSEGVERDWLRRQLGRIADGSKQVGAHFAVVTFPFRRQVEGGASGALHRQVAVLGREGGWPTLDLLPAYLAVARTQNESLFLDLWHPTAQGHDVAARALLRALSDLGWVEFATEWKPPL